MPLPTLLALLSLGLGIVLEAKKILPARLKTFLALAMIRLLYPCLILAALLQRLNGKALLGLLALPVLTALMLLGGLAFGIGLEDRLSIRKEGTKRSFRFLCLLPNYSYLPLMVAQARWGDEGVTLVAIAGVGADLVLWTIGVAQITRDKTFAWKRLLFNPPLLALVLALALLQTPMAGLRAWLEPALGTFHAIGSATIPVSMLVLGTHLGRTSQRGGDRPAQLCLLALRLLLIPGCLTLIFCLLPTLLDTTAKQVMILIGSMPGAILAVVLSEMHDADPDFAARHILVGHLLWIITGAGWLGLASWLM